MVGRSLDDLILSHKLQELSYGAKLSKRDIDRISVLLGEIRRHSGTAVLAIHESLNLTKI
jgi:hypothetical protein